LPEPDRRTSFGLPLTTVKSLANLIPLV
jgi:hypothetical protein